MCLKDKLRYVILAIVTLLASFNTIYLVEFVFEHKDSSTALLAFLGTVNASVLGAWTFVLKWFFQTKVHDA